MEAKEESLKFKMENVFETDHLYDECKNPEECLEHRNMSAKIQGRLAEID